MRIDELAREMTEAQTRQREMVRSEVVNRVLRAPETPNQSKRTMLGLDRKRRPQKSAPMFEDKGLF
ncbi:MAG: hypothetical protein LAP85_22000 [Acidobacteriia bacterium]|nr:hypothetical protein [Terriglobia bacterium]